MLYVPPARYAPHGHQPRQLTLQTELSLIPLVRADPCRKSILALIGERSELANDGISAKDIHTELGANGRTFTRDAVYRTMRRLAAEGTLRWVNHRFYAARPRSNADR